MNQMQIKKRRSKSGESDSDKIIVAIGRLQGNIPGRATVEAAFIEQLPSFLDDMAAPENADVLFLRSLAPELRSMTRAQMLRFKAGVIELMSQVPDDEKWSPEATLSRPADLHCVPTSPIHCVLTSPFHCVIFASSALLSCFVTHRI